MPSFTPPRLLLLAAATALALLLAACEGDAESAGGDGVFVDLLSVIPDTPEVARLIEMGNVERARDLHDIERPDLPPSEPFNAEAFAEYLVVFQQTEESGMPIVAPQFFPSGSPGLVGSLNTHDAFGITAVDVDQWVTVGIPPRQLHGISGAFDPADMEGRLQACAQCPPADTEEYRNWPTYAWDEDVMTRQPQPPFFDPAGRGGRLAVSDRFLLYTTFDDSLLRAMIDAHEGDDSLAGNEDFRLAAEGMDRLEALHVFLTDETQLDVSGLEEREEVSEAWTPREDDTLLLPYSVVAIGTGWDGEPYTAVALVHATEEDAEENADRLPDRIASARFAFISIDGADQWGDVFDEIDIEVDGRVVLARLYGRAILPGNVFVGGIVEPLLQHEP